MKNHNIKTLSILFAAFTITCSSIASASTYVAVGKIINAYNSNNKTLSTNKASTNNAPRFSRSLADTTTVQNNGTSSTLLLTSADGMTWNQTGMQIPLTTNLESIASNKQQFVAVGAQQKQEAIASISSDGKIWKSVNLSQYADYLNNVAWNGKVWVATGGRLDQNNYLISLIILVSTDGITWQSIPAPMPTTITHPTISSIVWNGEKWVAVGSEVIGNYYAAYGQNFALISKDGYAWTYYNIDTQTSNSYLANLSWNSSAELFAAIVVSDENYSIFRESIVTSADGINWTVQVQPQKDISLVAMQASTTKFVAIGESYGSSIYGRWTYTSDDGKTWNLFYDKTPTQFLNRHGFWFDDTFFVYGYGMSSETNPQSAIIYSKDGSEWSKSIIHQVQPALYNIKLMSAK